MKIITVVGARPNFIKVAPLHRALLKWEDLTSLIVHTGQHSDFQMSGIFFQQLGLPEPDCFLNVKTGTHAQVTAMIMLEFEKVVQKEKPDLVIVVGDVNSTLACALVCAKEHIQIAHIEAGLRSRDRSMPEEINRILTDAISDQLFVTEQSAIVNLANENIPIPRIHWVGNLMIDSLVYCMPQIEKSAVLEELDLFKGSYILMTMHRPANVDDMDGLSRILSTIKALAELKTVVLSMHPRTKKNISSFGLLADFGAVKGLKILEPQGYLEFLKLAMNASFLVTDSGGIQEETTYLNVPCITLRESTERPVTVEEGTNHLLPQFETAAVMSLALKILKGNSKKAVTPRFWDGNTAERIVAILREKYINSYVCDK